MVSTVEESPRLQKVAVLKIQVVGKNYHRVTVEWTLDGRPIKEWIDAFNDSMLAAGGYRSFVPSAYGRPLLMDDGTIVWAMFETDMQTAVSYVEQVVAHTNAELDGLVE
jgi:hypothetical protein